jgi:hypothetical protein
MAARQVHGIVVVEWWCVQTSAGQILIRCDICMQAALMQGPSPMPSNALVLLLPRLACNYRCVMPTISQSHSRIAAGTLQIMWGELLCVVQR